MTDQPTSLASTSQRGLLWVDGVGGYWVCWGERVVLGQPAQPNLADVPIWGDVSRQHAVIRRQGEGYQLEPWRSVSVAGQQLTGPTLLLPDQTVQLGHSVQFRFRRPHPWSQTARLDWLSSHRTQPMTDAVILLADVCVLGAGPHCHVVCPGWSQDLILVRQGDQWLARSPGEFKINNQVYTDQGPIDWQSRISLPQGTVSLEVV